MGNKKNFPNKKSLEVVERVINEAAQALNNPECTVCGLDLQDISQIVGTPSAAIAGASLGVSASTALIAHAGFSGLSAAGITSGLAATGGSLLGGIFVAALPPVAIAVAAGSSEYAITDIGKNIRLNDCKKILRDKAEEFILAINEELMHSTLSAERRNYLSGLIVLLNKCVTELNHDLYSRK